MAHTQDHRDELLARVRRIAGQVSAIERAIAEENSCAAILHQVAGVRGAVFGLMDQLIEEHLVDHVAKPGLSDAERSQGADDVIAAVRRYAK